MDAAFSIRDAGHLQESPQHSFWLPKVIEVCLAVSELHIGPSLGPIIYPSCGTQCNSLLIAYPEARYSAEPGAISKQGPTLAEACSPDCSANRGKWLINLNPILTWAHLQAHPDHLSYTNDRLTAVARSTASQAEIDRSPTAFSPQAHIT